jgi:hypothetical protein
VRGLLKCTGEALRWGERHVDLSTADAVRRRRWFGMQAERRKVEKRLDVLVVIFRLILHGMR